MTTTQQVAHQAIVDAGQIDELRAIRLRAVRDAYWAASGAIRDMGILAEALELSLGLEAPTKAQQRALFDMLPPEIFGAAITHGFDCGPVRAQIKKFSYEKAEAIGQAVGAS